MNFLNSLSPWQWALLAAVPPAIVALYFLKLRRQRLEVPSTLLWQKSMEDLHVNSPWQRIRQSLLLYLQLLIVALFIMALLRPGWHSTELTGGRSIFLIDNSASMSAIDVSPSRLDEAKRKALALIEQIRPGDQALVISFSDTARMETGFTENTREARQAVENIQPTNRSTNIDEALRLAAGFASPHRSAAPTDEHSTAAAETAKLFILSDGRFPPTANIPLGNLEPVFIPVGSTDAANVGIVAFSVRRSSAREDRLQAFGSIQNFSDNDVRLAVDLLHNNKPIDAARVTIPAHEETGVVFELGQLSPGMLELRITNPDALLQDNRAWAPIKSSRLPKVLLVTPGNKALELALSTPRAHELAEIAVVGPEVLKTKEHQQAASQGAFDLIVYDRCRPEQMPRANTLFIAQTPPQPIALSGEMAAAMPASSAAAANGWSLGESVVDPQIIDAVRNHPLMQWLDMGDVNIASARPVTPPPGGTRLLDSNRGCLLAIAPREEFEDAVLGLEIYNIGADGRPYANTNWPIRQSFPSFVYAVLEYLGGNQAALGAETVRPGQSVALKTDPSAQRLQVRTPGGALLMVPRAANGSVHFNSTGELGPYEVVQDGTVIQRFAVNLFDPLESEIQISREKSIQLGQITVAAQQEAYQPVRRETWKWLLLAALAVLFLEWYIYNRRVYV